MDSKGLRERNDRDRHTKRILLVSYWQGCKEKEYLNTIIRRVLYITTKETIIKVFKKLKRKYNCYMILHLGLHI